MASPYTPAQLAALKAQYEAGGVFDTGLKAVAPTNRPFSWRPCLETGCVTWPRISSGFGDRYNSVGAERGGWLWHLGTDWHLPIGTPIVAIGDGDVKAVIPESDPASGARGNTVIQSVEHGYALADPGEKITASYTHLQNFNVAVNQPVQRGDVIGYLGESGPNVGSPHLHLNIISDRGGATITDPITGAQTGFSYRYDFLQLLSGDMTPINPANPVPRAVPIAFVDQTGAFYPRRATVIWPFVCKTTLAWRFWMWLWP